MRKVEPLLPGYPLQPYDADRIAQQQKHEAALRKGMLISNTEKEFRYEWLKNDQHCFVAATIYENRLHLSDAEGWGTGRRHNRRTCPPSDSLADRTGLWAELNLLGFFG